MRLRNNIFAEAFDYLKREKGIKTQKRLAELMGVSEDTITRILKDRTEVTEDIITKLQTASGCIFNLQWLRGEDDDIIGLVNVAAAPFMANRSTEFSGALFSTSGTFTITLNDEWDAPWTGTW